MIKRQFHFGTEWIYVKIYSGPQMLDSFVANDLYSLFNEFYLTGNIKKIFFLRYSDDFHHLRIRFQVFDMNRVDSIVHLINKNLGSHIEKKLIWKIEYCTYNREVERYGKENIEDCETLFCYSSYVVTSILNSIYGNSQENARWLWGIKSFDALLDNFNLSLENKIIFLDAVITNYSEEYNLNKVTSRRMNDKFRILSKDIEGAMAFNLESVLSKIPNMIAVDYNKALSNIKLRYSEGANEPSLFALLQSLLHMHLNRLFETKQRGNEFVLCYFANKYYKSLKARQTKIGTQNQ
jgi:thiopeptide-type bacteriocin biosynthesis protein